MRLAGPAAPAPALTLTMLGPNIVTESAFAGRLKAAFAGRLKAAFAGRLKAAFAGRFFGPAAPTLALVTGLVLVAAKFGMVVAIVRDSRNTMKKRLDLGDLALGP